MSCLLCFGHSGRLRTPSKESFIQNQGTEVHRFNSILVVTVKECLYLTRLSAESPHVVHQAGCCPRFCEGRSVPGITGDRCYSLPVDCPWRGSPSILCSMLSGQRSRPGHTHTCTHTCSHTHRWVKGSTLGPSCLTTDGWLPALVSSRALDRKSVV